MILQTNPLEGKRDTKASIMDNKSRALSMASMDDVNDDYVHDMITLPLSPAEIEEKKEADR